MKRTTLAAYTIQCSPKHSRNKYFELNNVEGRDLHALIGEFLTATKREYAHDAENKFLLGSTKYIVEDRFLHGTTQTGEYGFSSTLYDITKEKPTYKRGPKEAELLPFYFQFYLPAGQTTGVLILERFGQFGIRKMLADELRRFLSEKIPAVSICIEPLVDVEFVKKLVHDGNIKRIRFRKLTIPAELCDRYGHKIQPDDGYVEYAIVAKKESILAAFHEMFGGNAAQYQIEDPPNFESDRVLIEVDLAGSKRTIDISDLAKMRSYYEVSEDVKFGDDGHPIYESIKAEATKLCKDLWRQMVG